MRLVLIIILIIFAVFLLAAFLIFLESVRELNKVRLTEYEFESPLVSQEMNGKSFVFLSDFHEAENGRLNSRITCLIKDVSPQFVIIGGDMINGGHTSENVTPAVELIKEISGIAPVYLAPGNHEMKVRDGLYPSGDLWGRYMEGIGDSAVRIENTCVEYKGINICGLDLDMDFYRRMHSLPLTVQDIGERLGRRKEGLTILAAHNPEYFEEYAAWGADLTLSGHYHGGIIRLPFLGGVISPKLDLFPDYDYGFYEKNGSRMIVTNGLGQHSMKIRINNIPEIVSITLKRCEEVW